MAKFGPLTEKGLAERALREDYLKSLQLVFGADYDAEKFSKNLKLAPLITSGSEKKRKLDIISNEGWKGFSLTNYDSVNSDIGDAKTAAFYDGKKIIFVELSHGGTPMGNAETKDLFEMDSTDKLFPMVMALLVGNMERILYKKDAQAISSFGEYKSIVSGINKELKSIDMNFFTGKKHAKTEGTADVDGLDKKSFAGLAKMLNYLKPSGGKNP